MSDPQTGWLGRFTRSARRSPVIGCSEGLTRSPHRPSRSVSWWISVPGPTIEFPGLTLKPAPLDPAASPDAPLPEIDTVVITWTVDEIAGWRTC